MRSIRLIAHNLRSLWNVGSLFRSSDAFAVERLYLTGYSACPPRKEISKTAIGAENVVAWEHHLDPLPLVEALHSDGWNVVSLELAPMAINLREYTPKDKVCLVLGHELSGIPQVILDRSDAVIYIPMLGSKESLNVAVAAGIALHHIRHAR